MHNRNQAPSIPWAGAAALALAVLALGLALAGPVTLSGFFQTWYLCRAAGLVAFVLLWGSVTLGLLQSTQFLKGVTSPIANIDVHGFVSLAALYATVFHAVIVLWDQYISLQLGELLVPFTSAYQPLWIGLGSVAFYVALGAVVTTYLRGHMNPRSWRQIHQISLLGFAAALVHSVVLGTDSRLPAVAFMYRFAAISVFALVGLRIYKGVSASARAIGRG